MDKDKYLDMAMELKDKYDIKCYKKNNKDKLYSFVLCDGVEYKYVDLEVDRIICRTYKLTIKELRRVKRYLRLYCDLTTLDI